MSFWVDIHAHLEGEEFLKDREEVINRAQNAGVEIIVNAATSLSSIQETLKLVERYPSLYASVGIHPQEIGDELPDFSILEEYVRKEKVIAIGEVGLDYYWDRSHIEKQKEAFIQQIEVAEKFSLPLIVHSRESNKDLWQIIKEKVRDVVVIWHCFSGDEEILQEALPRAVYFSLGGVVTYPGATHLREVVQKIPLSRVLLETDAPYLPPQSRRGRRNEPAFLVETASFLAQLWGVSLLTLREKVWENFCSIFGRKLDLRYNNKT
ncbi:MAG TPA: TatD family hydrolase [Candidatus Atribacteria bacterium]|jgi:TatD DNase family protein|uniref:TatD family hydrolase n=1 Tax=Candidatus Sordicultor fermentans TaxID=1953203 RepID=UPI0016AA94D7|nr:TatD family hydrolase [Atribacterota bacterium]NLY05781.1 TatD family hydrolase [Candidatus Atribacteria bacterium]MDI9606934.1 TatD family hydrolase [Atribacterota bacterium]MDY0134383.1 TatD family hydrolase [Atribacterota bacterium]HOA98863.1 TatD family hydrolase [Candidatus Atribacteria bacterium]